MKINFAKLFVLIAVSMFVGACDKIKSPSGPTDPPPDTKLEIVYDAPSIDVTDFVVEPQSDGSRNVRFRIRVDTGAGGLAKGEIGMVAVCYNNDPDSTFCLQTSHSLIQVTGDGLAFFNTGKNLLLTYGEINFFFVALTRDRVDEHGFHTVIDKKGFLIPELVLAREVLRMPK